MFRASSAHLQEDTVVYIYNYNAEFNLAQCFYSYGI